MKSLSLILLAVYLVFNQPLSLHASYIWAWGSNADGQANVPLDLTNALAISVGEGHNLALTGDGRVIAWGDNTYGQTNVPPDLTNVVAISAGGQFSLALRADGTVVAWGADSAGQIDVPTNLSGVIGISAGNAHCLALKANGTVVAWGDNDFSQATVPAGLTNVTAVAAGWLHSLALRANGKVVAWGDNQYGQCNVPSSLTNATAISAGFDFNLALRGNRTLTAWGTNNYGQLNIPSLTNVLAFSAGSVSALALKADGTVVAWGSLVNIGAPPAGITGATVVCADDFFALALAATPQGKPVISFIGPSAQSVTVGSQAFFSVTASGSAPLSYQWYFGSNAIAGATNRWLLLQNVSQSGTYHVVVTNALGSVTSQAVSLNVVPLLDINLVPTITLTGSVGSTYRVDYLNAIGSANGWTTLATVTLTNSSEFYFDTSSIGQPARLYRLVLLP